MEGVASVDVSAYGLRKKLSIERGRVGSSTLAQNVWPHGERTMGAKCGGFMIEKQMGHALPASTKELGNSSLESNNTFQISKMLGCLWCHKEDR